MNRTRDIHEVLMEHWGFTAFRPFQEPVVRSVIEGRDTLALLPTGAGKSLCFQVPALATGRLCLVVSPLIALMKDQVERLKQRGIAAVAITSGMRREEIENALESCAQGKRSFLYVSPERLGSELFMARLPRLPIGLLAVDEAHCISQWGYDFRPAYGKIREVRAVLKGVPVLALTASATPRVAEDIMRQLDFRERHMIRGSFRREEITWWVSEGEDKLGRLLRVAKRTTGSGIVYVRDRKGTLRIARLLQEHGIGCQAYHAGMDMDARDRVQRDWNSGATRFVAATTAFGMGIDKADVRTVVHMEPPPDLESYYQEAGRAGRDGERAHSVLLMAASDEGRLRDRVLGSFPPIEDVRRVYQAFADQHRIAIGTAQFETYALDLRALAERVDLKPLTVSHALKALELDGSVVLSEGVRDPSRVLIIAPPNVVYDLRVRDERLGPLLEALLRMHGGLFEDAVMIDEERLSQHLRSSVDKVIGSLKELGKMAVLVYRPRNDGPTVTLLTPRRDAQRLMLDPEALRERKRRAIERLDAMLNYLSPLTRCREAALLSYFGEQGAARCGSCDACKAEEREQRPVPASPIDRELLALSPATIERLRYEVDEGIAAEEALRQSDDAV